MLRKLLTADEVAELLSVGRSTVHDWARAGALPAYRVGRVVRFDPDLLERWLDGHLVGNAPGQTGRRGASADRVNRLRAAVRARVPGSQGGSQE